eukprot:TRINITY_DN20_c0_g1_i1.p1 TRINITY_DN20_c0_g1~~TRINITY_DN20_c0_g1_i1.p1  ORF type:complete len:948 (+),score=348.52 TRINITY_DN20_c0_g1_i1:72-2846(+)
MRGTACALLAAAGLAAAGVTKYELHDYDSVADPKAVVTAGSARFTVLTPRLLRIEYSAAGSWEDRATLAVVNRKLPVPAFNVSRQGSGVTIATASVKLTYTGGAFSAQTLRVDPAGPGGAFGGWAYGQTSDGDKGNLRGTFRTLDGTKNVTLNCASNGKPHCEYGLVSRSGWALIDDTGVPCLDDDDWWTDEQGKMLKNKDDADLYLLAHGHDYMGALGEYTQIGGHIPVFPRRNSGVWFTRWYDYANVDVRKIVEDYETRSIPLDIVILDMNWHTKNDWTGYSWDRNLYPYPADTMDYLHKKGIAVGANLHDATGIGRWEEQYKKVCEYLGLNPLFPGGLKGVPFTLVNKSYVAALEDIVLKAVEDDGMDFWWIDWQQGEDKGGTGQDGKRQKMNPTIWTDKMRVTDSLRRCKQGKGCTNKRGVVHARWGGLGNHRYQHGFSGDVDGLTWSNLAYQAYFSATASNVGWGFWSHDIEGPGKDHEMYTRWIQLACFSGIMRAHDRGMSAGGCSGWPSDPTGCPTVQPYNVPRYFDEANTRALRGRTELIPYIYTQTRIAYDQGVGITRPMYYHWPEEAAAYPADMESNLGQEPTTGQYMFGPDMLVAPVAAPGSCVGVDASAVLGEPCGLSTMQVWLPPGQWFERDAGVLRQGNTTISRSYALDEVPVFIRAGAVIPSIPLGTGAAAVGVAGRQFEALEFTVYPGADTGSCRVYEDDGESYDYLKGAFAWTTANYTRQGGSVLFNVATTGSYPSLPAQRPVTLRLQNAMPPSKVVVNGAQLQFSRWGGPGTWSFDGHKMQLVIEAPAAPTSKGVQVTVTAASRPSFGAGSDAMNGAKGLLQRALLAKRNLDEARQAPGESKVDKAPLSVLAATGDALSYLAGSDPAAFAARLGSISSEFEAGKKELGAAGTDGRHAYSVALLQTA